MVRLVVLAASGPEETPGIEALPAEVSVRFATESAHLAAAMPEADIVFSWDYRGALWREAWPLAPRLRWVHWAGAGVDAALVPEFVSSRVILTNSAGVFDQAIAEFVLALVLAFAKQIPESLIDQRSHRWNHRLTEQIGGRRATVVGVGGIGRATCRLLRSVGMEVTPIARSSRLDDELGAVHPVSDLVRLAAQTDVLIAAAPLTPDTRHLFDRDVFRALPPHSRFVNVGRGALVDEEALIASLRSDEIAGAALDVFATEPLPADSSLWDMSNVIITPHHAGDHTEHRTDLVLLFLENVDRYLSGKPLRNVVDRQLGFVPNV